MGIPSCRFPDKSAEQFTCTVCLDVAEDPLVLTDCEHIFCRNCIEHEEVTKCPTCQEPFKNPKWSEIKGGYKRVYLSLEVKCLNPVCDLIFNVTNYKDHDENCLVTFSICPDCGYKTRRGADDTHSCEQQVKMDTELKVMKKEVELLKVDLKKEVDESKQIKKDIKKEIEEFKSLLNQERDRYERLISVSVAYRNLISDFQQKTQTVAQGYTNNILNPECGVVEKFGQIKRQVDDHIKRNPVLVPK